MPVEEPKETPPSPPPPVVDEAPPPAPPPSLLPTPTITSGRFKADMTKYSFKQAPGKVKVSRDSLPLEALVERERDKDT